MGSYVTLEFISHKMAFEALLQGPHNGLLPHCFRATALLRKTHNSCLQLKINCRDQHDSCFPGACVSACLPVCISVSRLNMIALIFVSKPASLLTCLKAEPHIWIHLCRHQQWSKTIADPAVQSIRLQSSSFSHEDGQHLAEVLPSSA